MKDTKNTNDDDEYKEDNSKLQDGNERVDNLQTLDTLRDVNAINTTVSPYLTKIYRNKIKRSREKYTINI